MVIADENIDARIIQAIRELGINVISIKEQYPGISDEQVIELSKNPPKILIT